MKLRLGLVIVCMAAIGIGAGVWLAWLSPPPEPFTDTPLVPLDATPTVTSLPAYVSLPVPYTTQAPTGDWAASQHDCEEATLVMVDRYLRGDRSGGTIDSQTAYDAINRMTPWKVAQDLTDDQLGRLAADHLGWGWEVLPATLANIEVQLALGRPVVVGVRTHGLGNDNYPGYDNHYEDPAWSVAHYLVVAGYDSSSLILNDPGINAGHGYHISYKQLVYAIQDLDRTYPNLDQGLVMLVVAPKV